MACHDSQMIVTHQSWSPRPHERDTHILASILNLALVTCFCVQVISASHKAQPHLPTLRCESKNTARDTKFKKYSSFLQSHAF